MLDSLLFTDLPIFQDFTSKELKAFLCKGNRKLLNKSDFFFQEGEAAHSFFLLLDGHIRVTRITDEGQQIIVRYISAVSLFGVAQAIGQTVYPANAIAAVNSVALSWPMEMWDETIRAHPSFLKQATKTIGSHLLGVHERMVEMTTKHVEGRIAKSLLRLAEQASQSYKNELLITIPLTRQDISEISGTTLFTASRILSSWAQSGILSSRRKQIAITDIEALKTLAERT